eukprot:1160559-Pelagomonas_calceolata.AAC.6
MHDSGASQAQGKQAKSILQIRPLASIGAQSLCTIETHEHTSTSTQALEHRGTAALEHTSTQASEHRGTTALGHRGTAALEHTSTQASEHRGTTALGHRGTTELCRAIESPTVAKPRDKAACYTHHCQTMPQSCMLHTPVPNHATKLHATYTSAKPCHKAACYTHQCQTMPCG